MAAAARQAAMIPAGAGAERILAELAAAPMDDRSWLRAVRTFGELHGRAEVHESGGAHRLLVLLLLQSRERQRTGGYSGCSLRSPTIDHLTPGTQQPSH